MAQPLPAALPSMPGVVIKLLQMFGDSEVSIEDVVEIIKTDVALSGRILKAANSSAIAASREVADLKRAAMLLGKKTVSTLALSFSLADRSMKGGPNVRLFRNYWHKSLVTGVAAAVLARKFGSLRNDEAFLVGLLCRLGRLGAISFAAEEFEAVFEVSSRCGCSVDSMCLQSMGVNCEELTLQYLRSWKLPEWFIGLVASMQEADQNDRLPTIQRKSARPEKDISSATTIRAAAAVGRFFTGENAGIALTTLHELLQPYLQDPEREVNALIADIHKEFGRYADLLNVSSNAFGTPAELHAQAMAHLTEIMLTPDQPISESEHSAGEITWLKQRVATLAEKLTLDPMTSIYNRSYFDIQLEKHVAIARQVNRFVAILFVDINKFKQINDTYGHDVGDEAICLVASELNKITRDGTVVARYGGDEFVILDEMTVINGLAAKAQRITEKTTQLTLETAGRKIPISLAIGGAIGTPDGESDFGMRLLRAADQAMYHAKQKGSSPTVRELTAADRGEDAGDGHSATQTNLTVS